MTNEELKQFKSAISITTVAQSLGINVSHGRFRCVFPQRHTHADRTPSVSISEERGTFRCWVCDDVRGDVISLVQLVKDCSFVEALNWLMEQYPFLVPPSARKEMAKIAERASNAAAGPRTSSSVVRLPEDSLPPEPEEPPLVSDDERKKIILSFLKRLSPVDNTPAAKWLARRRIYKPVWDKMLLRTITNYEAVNNSLKDDFGEEVLKFVGLFNDKGHLRYYKHPLIFPYLDYLRPTATAILFTRMSATLGTPSSKTILHT